MAETFVDRLYPGMGIANQGSPQDTGAVAKTSTPNTVVITIPANADATQPTIDHGQLEILISGLNAATVIAGIEVVASDGTLSEYLANIPATGTATAGQGLTYYLPLFSALVNITNIVTLTVRVVSSGSTNSYTLQARFNYGD
jgi:hypothetical protein